MTETRWWKLDQAEDGRSGRRPFMLRYGLAVLATFAALGFNLFMQPIVTAPTTALFFAAVMVSSWYGGLGPGLVSTFVAGASSFYLIPDPVLSGLIRVSVLVVEAVLISSLAARSKDAEGRLRRINLELEDRVRERTAELEEGNQQLEDFCYTIAHDLRAPLRAAQGFSQALIEESGEQLDESSRGYVRRISDAARRMDRLIRDLLDFTHISQTKLKVKSIDLGELTGTVLEQFADRIGESKARVEVRGPLPGVLGHWDTARRVISELVSNALTFVPEGREPCIRISAEARGEFVRLWIEDNGIGVERRFYDRIYRVFERLEADQQSGTGIGLAIVKRGVERMGGQVGVESQPGHGSRFWIELRRE